MANLQIKTTKTYIIELTEDEYSKLLQCVNLSTILPRSIISAFNIDYCEEAKLEEINQDGKTK